MKIKIFVYLKIIILFMALLSFTAENTSYASSFLKVTSIGPAIKSGGTTVQNITLNFKENSPDWKILVTALDDSLKNSFNPSKKLSLDNLVIENFNGDHITVNEPNKPYTVGIGTEVGEISKNLVLRYKNNDADYPGTYTGYFQFNIVSSSGTSVNTYNFSIEQPVNQKIYTTNNTINMKIKSENALKKGFKQELDIPSRLYISSNSDWKLILKSNKNINELLDLKFKILSCPSDIKKYFDAEYSNIPSDEFVLMEGGPTIDPTGKILETKAIEINYQINTKENEILPSGDFRFDADYTISPK